MNRGLDAGLEKIYAILYFGVRKWNFVTQTIVQGEAGSDFESILRVDIEIISAQTAGEIATALQKENRLADFKTCERVCERRIYKNEKAVAGDSLQYVDLIVAVAAAEFHFVASANPGERAVQIEGVFVSVARTRDRIAYGSKACDLNEWRAECGVERGLVGEAERGRIGVIDVLVKEEFIAEERESRQADDGGRKSVRLLRDKTLRPMIFPHGESGNVCAGGGERVGHTALAEAVAKIENIFGGEIVIETQAELVFVLRLRECGDEGGVACVRQWIERENVLRNRINAGKLIVCQRLGRRCENVVKLVISVRKLLGIMN